MNPSPKSRKILFWLGLSFPTIALLVMAWLVHQSNGDFNNSLAWAQQSYQVLNLLEQTQGDILDAEANQRGFLMTGNSGYLKPYRAAMEAVRQDIAQLKSMSGGNPAQQSNLALLEKLVNEDLAFDPDKAFLSGQPPAGAAVSDLTERGMQKVNQLRRLLVQSQQDQQLALSRRQQEAEASVARSRLTSLVLLSIVALTLILVVIIRARAERLQQIVTVCAWTGQVKFQGQWLKLDEYLQRQFGIMVSHSLSQEAADKMMKEMEDINRQNR